MVPPTPPVSIDAPKNSPSAATGIVLSPWFKYERAPAWRLSPDYKGSPRVDSGRVCVDELAS